MRSIRYALVGVVLVLAVSAAMAQTGGLRVVVTDAQGPLPGGTVILTNEMGYVGETSMLTDPNGVALFPVLRAGAGYKIVVSFPGYSTIENPGLRVRLNDTITVNIQLFQELVEKVVVDGTRDTVDLDKTEVQSTKFSDEFIQDLPVPGRFYQNVLTMAPGVNDDNGDGNPTVHGSRSRDFKAVVGGVSNVDPLTGRFMSLVNPNSIEEMEVISAGAGVEFGRAQGGFARIIQKQGSNQFEGLAEFIYRSSKLDGNGATNLTGDLVPEFDWYQPSVQLSGPIVKDKLWYRLSHEAILREDPINTGSSVYVTSTRQGINSDQLTWQVSPRNKLAFVFEYNPLKVENAGVSAFVSPESARTIENDFTKYSLTWTAPYSPKILIETTIAYQDSANAFFPSNPEAENDCVGVNATDTLKQTQCFDVLRGSTSGASFVDWADNRQRFSLLSQATIFGGQFIGASHQIKVGLNVENERYYRELTQSPLLTLTQRQEQQDTVEGEVGSFERETVLLARLWSPESSASRATGTNWGIYFQDQIKPTQNLTLTIGARVDRENINANGAQQFDPEGELSAYLQAYDPTLTPTEQNQIYFDAFTGFERLDDFVSGLTKQLGSEPACSLCPRNTQLTFYRRPDNIQLSNTNISPFISVAWDPWSNGKTKFAASAGRYHNNIPLLIPMIELAPASADLDIVCGRNGDCSPSAADISPNISVVDRDLRTPYQDEWTLQVDREIAAETSLRVTYINRKYRDQIQDVDINHAPGDFGRCVEQARATDPTVVPVLPTDSDWDPNNPGGDGLIDDCVGELIADPSGAGDGLIPISSRLQRPDGIDDLYVQSPIWGDIFLIGNTNFADYQGISLEVIRRQYRGWEMAASYTLSEAKGNGEDFFQNLGDDRTLIEDEAGYQSNDRRHVVKFNATTITPWGFRFGTSISWLSGLPYSVQTSRVSRDALPPVYEGVGIPASRLRIQYPTGQRNDERNNDVWNIDLKFTKEMNIAQRVNLQLSAEIFNLLNDGTYFIYTPAAELGIQRDGRNNGFNQFGRRFQLGAKVTF